MKYSQTSKFFVIVPKTITLDADKTSSYTVDANGDIASNEKTVVIPDETVTMKDVNSVKTDVIGTISQDKTEWLYNEMNIDATSSVSVQNLIAGTWKGVFYFNVALANTENVVEDELTSEPTIKNLSTENVIDVNNSLSESRHEVNEEDIVATFTLASTEDKTLLYTFDLSDIADNGDKISVFEQKNDNWEWNSLQTVKNDSITALVSTNSNIVFVEEKAGLINEDGTMIYSWGELLSNVVYHGSVPYKSSWGAKTFN